MRVKYRLLMLMYNYGLILFLADLYVEQFLAPLLVGLNEKYLRFLY